jgi:TP901 family phage tail tape measure protein
MDLHKTWIQMSYNVFGEKSSMAELAGMYEERADVPGAKIFQTPDVTKEMKGMKMPAVMSALLKENITPEKLDEIVSQKGLKGPEATEKTARGLLYDKVRTKQLEKIYVKSGIGENTEAINKTARFLEASVGFGEKQIGKEEYAGWKEKSVALGAVYDKGGKLTQKALPAREMQTMMNVMLEQVINTGMRGTKHGTGGRMHKDLTKGLAFGDLFQEMQGDKRFKDILKANEIIKQTIRNRLDALNTVDFAAEAKRHDLGKGKKRIKGRKAITEALADRFSFEGFSKDMSKDIQNQALEVIKTRHKRRDPKAEGKELQASAEKELTTSLRTGEFDVASYFPEMQPKYMARTSSTSIDSLAKKSAEGKTKLDKAMHRVLSVVRSSGTGAPLSDTLVQSSFGELFNMFETTERLGKNVGKIFKKDRTFKQKEADVSGLEKRFGIARMPVKEKEMLMAEAREQHIKEFPDAKEDTIQAAERKAVIKARQAGIKRTVAVTKYKKDLLLNLSPEFGKSYAGYKEVVEEARVPTKPSEKPPMPPQGKRAMFGGVPVMGVAREEWAMDEERVAAALQEKKIKEQERRKVAARKRGKLSKGEYIYPQPFDIKAEDFKEPYSFRKDISSALKSREIKSRALIHAQTLKQTGFETQMPGGELWLPGGPRGEGEEQIPRGKKVVPKIPRGKTSDVDYSMFGVGPAKDFVKVLEKYKIALGKLSEGAENLTKKQKAKAEEALRFVERHRASLASIPEGAKGRRAAADVLSLSDKMQGIKREPTTPAGAALTEKKPSPYKSKLEALVTMVTKAEAATGFSPEGMPSELMDVFSDIRTKRTGAFPASQAIRGLIDIGDIDPKRQASVWKQYHVEKVKAHSLTAQKADKEKDYATKEEAIRDAKKTVARTWGSSLSPFLTRDRPGGRVTGQIDEEASAMLGLRPVGVEKKQIYDTAAVESPTAAHAMKPLLFGTERMESRLKETWAILRRFSPEMAKAGNFAKAFNFETAKQDIAVIIEGLYKLKASSFNLTPEESADVKHAIKMTTKMQDALQQPGKTGVEKILPTVAIPGLESRETALTAWENLQAKTMEDMMSEAAVEGSKMVPKVSRKIAMDVPTEGGLIEKKKMTLVARGDQAYGAAGKVVGIRKIDEKSTIEEPGYQPSRRSLRLFEQFSKSTGSLKNRIRDAYLGVKRFSSATGKVNFDEALSDLKDLQILIAATLKMPGLTREEGFDIKHLGKKMAYAHKTLSETSPEGMPGVVMKDMETTKSALTAFKEQRKLTKEALMETEGIEPGMATTVAATIPTAKGPIKQKVKLVVEGDPEGRVTGVREERYKPKKRFVDELLEGKTSKGASLFKSFMEGTGNTNKRISDMLLGVKRFNMEMIKSGKHANAVNFDKAEEDLIEMIALFDRLLKGSTTLTDQERERCTMARTAAKEMKTKVIKTPVGARRGITMGGYETPESSLAAHRADIETRKRELLEKGELGRTATVTGRIMTKSGQEEARKTKLTTRGDRWFGFGGRAAKVTERDESPQGQTGSVLRRVAMWGSASGVIYGIIGGVRSMLETMKVAETGMVNLQKVMPRVGTDFDKMRDSAIGFAKTYGAELKGVLETMRIFAQQGLPQPQVLELTRVSTLAANVTTMDPTKSAEALTSATRQFNIEGEDAIKILDSWNEVENKFAITAADLADGFKKAGTAARITGIDVHKLNGIITAIGEATRQTGKEVGTSLKFIFSRMATEKAPKALTAVGVETMEGGRLREGSDILDDLAGKWVGLTRSQKLATAQAIGGIRHYNALMVLMANYHRALSATEASINSVGSAEKENKMVMETYAKQLAKTKASFDSLAVSTSSSILPMLQLLTKTIRGLIDVTNMIPQGGLGALVVGAYAAATGLGKYFDLSMYGLLGERGVGGEKRKRTTPWEWGPAAKKKYAPMGERAMGAGALSSMMFGVKGAEERKLAKVAAPAKLKSSVGALTKLKNTVAGIGPAYITARNTAVGFLASLSPFAKIVLVLAAVGAAVWGMGKALGSTFAMASERSKDYIENLEIVEATLDKIKGAHTLSKRVSITTKRVELLNELTPKQVAAQVQGRSYKSPLLMMKTQQLQVQEYANSVASMTTEGIHGFDSFGNAIISTTDELGNVVAALEEIATKSMVDLKLNIIGEQLKDLTSPPEVEGAWDTFVKRVRDIIRGGGKLVGVDLMKGYMNTFEKTSEVMDKMGEMKMEAYKEGRAISPPSIELKKKDPKLYEKRKEEYKDFSKANVERMGLLKEFKEGFSESKRDFMTIRRPGLSPELATKAAFGETGAQLASIEEATSPFYKKRGVEQAEIQAGYFHKLIGSMAIRPTAMLTRETAMEQGIAPREATAAVLEALRPGDIMLAKEGVRFKDKEGEFGISTGQIQVLKGVGEAGEDFVAYVREGADESGKITTAVFQSKNKFFEMLGGVKKVAEDIREVVDSAGMLSETAMKIRAVSIRPTGAEAGMFKPTTAKKLDLGKQYKFQVDTSMLIQNNAFGNLSKGTEKFVNSYVKKQGELRRSQKIALDVYGKRGVIDDADADAAKALALSLAGVANTAIQLTRATTEMDKSFARLTLRAKEQAAVKEVGREVKLKRTGLLAGMPEVKVPQIDIRRFSELSGHEKLRAASPEYEKTLLAHDKQLDVYNAAVAKAEASAKTLADIEYIEEEAAGRGISQKEIDDLVAGVAMTGSKETGPMLSELSVQTQLQHEMVTKLTSLEAFSAKGKDVGIAHAGIEREEKGLWKGVAAHKQTESSVRSDIAGYVSRGDWQGVSAYSENLKKALLPKEDERGFGSRPAAKAMTVRAQNLQQESVFAAIGPEELKAILTSSSVGVKEKDYKEAKEKGKVDELFFENFDKVMKYMLQLGKQRKGEVPGGAEKQVVDYMSRLKEGAGLVIEERKEYAEKVHKANLEDAKVQGNIAAVFAQSLSKSQKAMRMFTLVAGDLAKSVETLSESFLKLEKQSMINKALIDTRAKYRSTRGGPMERQAPSVDIDVSTTAQYRPHQLLYEQSAQYKSATTGYLKNMEDVKTARSKLEELSKIEAQKEFLGKQPGVKKEDVDSFVSAAMRTGSVEIAPIVVELAKLNKTASSIDDKTVELKDGKPVTGEQQKSGEEMLFDAKRQAEADNRRAEMLAKRSADYMRKAQIRKQTDIEIATGSGKSQDQINKEESGWIASVGYVPSEIKERNQRLRAEYEKEKRARAEFELNKQRMLKPLQQAAGGMGSIISSIQTGVAGIKGGRNVRPLEEDFTRWAQGRDEEDVAEARGQFDLAKSIYSQNLSLRAQGADTGVAPRKLYDIMERASKGEDVTEELKAIESVLAEKKEEKEEQIRKIQAQEYAKAMSSSEGTKKTNTELSAINENTRTMTGTLNEGFSKVTSAIEAIPKTEGVAQQAALEKEKTQKTLQAAKDTGAVVAYEAPLGKKAIAEATASHVYTGAYDDITKTPVEEHQWGVPVSQDEAYAFVEKTLSKEPLIAEAGIPVVEKEEYLPASDEQRKKSQMAAALPSFGKDFVETDFGYADRLKEAGKTEEEIKKEEMIKSAAKGGLTMTLPEVGESVEEFAERTKSPEQKREEAARLDVESKYKSDRPTDSYDILKEELDTLGKTKKPFDEESKRDKLFDGDDRLVDEKEKAAGIKEERKETKELKEKSLKETEQGKESKKEGEKLNKEVSDLKDEIEKLKTTITDVNTAFEDLSDSADNIAALGNASKDSAAQVDTFGKSIFSASSSLDIFSSKASTATAESNEQGPTMVAEEVDFNFISEEDAINLVNFTKGELLENINNIDNTELLDSLVEKTDIISKDVASIKEGVTVISDAVSEEDFNVFKEKAFKYFEEVDKIKDIELDKLASSTDFDDLKTTVADYIETVGKLEKLTDTLADTSSSHFTSILDLEKAFDLVSNELRDYNEKFTKLESSLGSMDHKFTTLIDDLKEDVGEVMNLAWAARSLASQNI